MAKNTKQNPPRGKPRYAISSIDSNGGLQLSYVEDELIKVPVPLWLDPRGYQEMPSWVALRTLLLPIQRENFLSRGLESTKCSRKRLRKAQKNIVRAIQGSASRDKLNEAVRAVKAIHSYPTERLRKDALDRFASLYPRPVAPQRLQLVEPAVYERAREDDRPTSAVLADAVKAAAPLLHPTSSPERSCEATLRQQLNDLVTEDFLGPGWRRTSERSLEQPRGQVPMNGDHLDAEDGFLDRINREKFFDKLREVLSPRERELLDVRLSGADYREWAKKEWGWKDSTVDNTMSRVRKKLEELARRKRLL